MHPDDKNEIDTPARKQILWHRLRGDLQQHIPEISQNFLLLCPTCCRFLTFDDFSLEHVIPQKALGDDPPSAKKALSNIDRSCATLLCNKELLIKGNTVYKKGCNSWKGRFYDRPLREIFNGRASAGSNFTSRHHVALSIACFLGLFAQYGFQIALSESGLIMRRQFFRPNDFVKDIPIMNQIALMGEPFKDFSEDTARYWTPPFKFIFEDRAALVVVRNASMRIPLSRNPELPLACRLPFAPSRFKLRPNFETVFR